MPVAGHPLEVGVELEVLHRILVVPFHEADGGDPLPQHAQDAQRDLVLVGAEDLDAAALALQHRRVVDPHPVRVGHARLLVGIDGAHVQVGIATPQHLHHVLGAPPFLVLGLVEVGQLHVPPEEIDDLLGLLRRGEHALAGEVEVGVVEHERHVGQHRDAECGQDDGGGVGDGERAPQPRLQWQPRPEDEEHREGREPGHEPDGVDGLEAIHPHRGSGGDVYRRASARLLRNRPVSTRVRKKPTSDRNSAPVAKGVKCATSEAWETIRSNGSGSR